MIPSWSYCLVAGAHLISCPPTFDPHLQITGRSLLLSFAVLLVAAFHRINRREQA